MGRQSLGGEGADVPETPKLRLRCADIDNPDETHPVLPQAPASLQRYLLASAVFVSTRFAAVWKETNNKGLEVYTVGNKQSTKFYLFTTLHNEQLAGPTIIIKAGDYNAAFPYEGGAIIADGGWNKLIEALSKPGSVSITVGAKKIQPEARQATRFQMCDIGARLRESARCKTESGYRAGVSVLSLAARKRKHIHRLFSN